MAFIENSSSLEQVYQTLPTGTDLSYNNLSLNSALPDANQLTLTWKLSTVEDSTGASISLASQSDAFVRAAQEIQTSLYTVEVDDKDIDASLVGGSTFDVAGATYTRPALTASTVAAQPIIIRRSTNVTSPVVSYQPGARLTSEMLNTSEAQTLNAIQELTVFATPVSGSGGGGGDVDPSEINITQLDGVNLTSTGIANWDATTGILSSTGSGNLVPQSGTNTPGFFLKQTDVNDGDIAFAQIEQDDVFGLSNTLLGLAVEQANLGNDVATVEGKIQNIATSVVNDSTNFVGDLTATGDITATGDMSAIKFEMPTGYLTYDNTTVNQADGVSVYNNMQLNIPGTDTGGGSYLTRNGDGSVIRNTNAAGYEWFYQADNDYNDPSTWRQDGAILVDPRAKDSSNNNMSRVLLTENTGSSYQNHSSIVGRTNRSMWRTSLNDYTYVLAPGDESGSVFTSVKEIDGAARTIYSVDENGNGYFRGNVTANGVFIEGSDATTKTYVPSQDPSGSIIDKIQSLTTLGAFEYNDQPGVYHYGPTTQDLAAVGLSIAKGVNIDVPAGATEEATPETDASSGSVAEASTQTIETISMTGLLTKAAVELKDLDDEINNNIVYLTSYIQALEARVAALEGNSPTPPVLPSPTTGTGLSGGEGGQLGNP